MSDKYDILIQALADRDRTLVMLFLIVLALILAWVGLDWLPQQYRKPIKRVYMIGGFALYILTIIFSIGA